MQCCLKKFQFDRIYLFVGCFYVTFQGLNYNYLYSINGWLLLNPWWLCFDWSMGCIPTISTFTDPRILGAATVCVVAGALLWTCLKAPITQDQR